MKIHFLKSEWSDVIILEKNGHIALIDTGFEENYGKLSSYIKKNFPATEIDFILNTHFHRDHYGSVSSLVKDFKVNTVYMKEYSVLDSTTAWGTAADDTYRQSEKEKFEKISNLIREKSNFILLNEINSINKINFCDIELNLFNTENTIRRIFNDESNADTYHKICFSENMNSLSVFFSTGGKNIFLGGDMMDHDAPHPLASKMLLKVAKKIGKEIDLYKVPHHGTRGSGTIESLSIFKPKTAVFTNSPEYIKGESDALSNLQTVNPNVNVFFTNQEGNVFDIPEETEKPVSFLHSITNLREITFRKGKIEDLDEIWAFVQASISKMISQKIFQWDDLYPCRNDFEDDIKKGDLSLGIINGKICCIYVINTDFDDAYNNAAWIYKGNRFCILHRIVVNPEFQNQGIGRQTMIHLMEDCRISGSEALRLDVFSQNPYSQRLYDSLGFVKTGEAQWRKGLFYLLEKKL